MLTNILKSQIKQKAAATANASLLFKQQARYFRTSQPLGNKFNVYIDGKPV